MVTTKIHYNHLFCNEQGFDMDLFSIDRVFYNEFGKVEYAERLFRIPAPIWMQRLVAGWAHTRYMVEKRKN